jgi:hypothetical protein
MGRLNDDIIEESDQEGPRLEFVSLEDSPHERLRFVGLSFGKLPETRCLARVELERRPGQTVVASWEGRDTGPGKLRAAAEATLKAIIRSTDASADAFTLVGIKAVKVFAEAAVIVAVTVSYDGGTKRMVGFCVIDEEHPYRAASLAVLNATNRFLGAVLAGKISWQRSGVLHR